MKSLRVLIVDDEPLARDCIRVALQREPDLEVVGECESGEEALECMHRLRPDLVLLDVQMPEMSGFDVVAQLAPEDIPLIVFVTAFEQHAMRAFEVHAVDYVLKPFDDRRLLDAVRHAQRLHSDRGHQQRVTQLLELLADVQEPGRRRLRRLVVKERDRMLLIPIQEIDWFEGARNYVRVHTRGRAYLVRGPLAFLHEQLDPQQFARIHRSTIVNINRIKEVQPWTGGDFIAVLHTGDKLRVSRHYKDALLGEN